MGKLTLAQLSSLAGKIATAAKLDLHGKGLSDVDDLYPCRALSRLDVSGNALTSLRFARDNEKLTVIQAKDNQLSTLEGLAVLNIANNEIKDLSPLRSPQLNALIANANRLEGTVSLRAWSHLNTLVLSNNNIQTLNGLKALPQLRKLSLSNNALRALPSLAGNLQLKELRVNHNKLSGLPDDLALLGQLNILEVSHNLIFDLRHVEIVAKVRSLRRLNVSNNPVCSRTEDMQAEVRKLAPFLRNIDCSGPKTTEGGGGQDAPAATGPETGPHSKKRGREGQGAEPTPKKAKTAPAQAKAQQDEGAESKPRAVEGQDKQGKQGKRAKEAGKGPKGEDKRAEKQKKEKKKGSAETQGMAAEEKVTARTDGKGDGKARGGRNEGRGKEAGKPGKKDKGGDKKATDKQQKESDVGSGEASGEAAPTSITGVRKVSVVKKAPRRLNANEIESALNKSPQVGLGGNSAWD